MGWLGSIFGSRKRREARRQTEERLRARLAEAGAQSAWRATVEALAADPEHDGLLHLAADVLRAGGEVRTAELFDRAADAPHDPQRLFELGSALLSEEQPEVAGVLLERALRFVPFDAVVRSELSLAHARSGRPDKVLEALALHPCLGDDPGALFEFGWASLLTGDLEAARGALGELHGAPSLRRKLALALERAEVGMGSDPPDARDFYFVEHGGLLLDASGPLRGRHESLTVDGDRARRLLADLGWVLRELMPRPRHVIALDDAHYPLALAVARACDGSVMPAGRGRLPAGLLPVLSGRVLEEQLDEASQRMDGLIVFALSLDWQRSVARAPEIVGAFARRVERAPEAFRGDAGATERREVSGGLEEFVERRLTHLPPAGPRVRSAYVPDAPLPRGSTS